MSICSAICANRKYISKAKSEQPFHPFYVPNSRSLALCLALPVPRLRFNRFCKRPVAPIAITLPSNNLHTNESKSTSASLESNRTNRILFAIVFFPTLWLAHRIPRTNVSQRGILTNRCRWTGNQPKCLSTFFFPLRSFSIFRYIFINAFRFEWATCFWSIFQFA